MQIPPDLKYSRRTYFKQMHIKGKSVWRILENGNWNVLRRIKRNF